MRGFASRPAARFPSALMVNSLSILFTSPSTRFVVALILSAVTSSPLVTKLKTKSSIRGSIANRKSTWATESPLMVA